MNNIKEIVQRIFTFEQLSKLFVIYLLVIVVIITMEIDFSDKFLEKLLDNAFSEKRIMILSVKDRIGESMLYERMIEVAKLNKYDFIGINLSETLQKFWLTEHFYQVTLNFFTYVFKPKVNLALTHHVRLLPKGYNVTYINMPNSSLFTADNKFQSDWEHLNDYDSYLDVHSMSNGRNSVLEKIARYVDGKNKKIIPAYFGCILENFVQNEPKKALITGSLWGCGRSSLRIFEAFRKLGEEDLLFASGMKSYFNFLGKNYLGRLEHIKNKTRSPKSLEQILMDIQQEHGIALILHNFEHMAEGIPTSRIAEAIKAGSLIISDEHQFLSKFFGDNVLYFKNAASSEEIYHQIKNHIIWARENPQIVRAKILRTQEIFQEKFDLNLQFNEVMSSLIVN